MGGEEDTLLSVLSMVVSFKINLFCQFFFFFGTIVKIFFLFLFNRTATLYRIGYVLLPTITAVIIQIHSVNVFNYAIFFDYLMFPLPIYFIFFQSVWLMVKFTEH